MAKKQMIWKTKGMNKDLSVSSFSPEFAFENMNLRLSTSEANTMLSWVNEKGTAELSLIQQDYWTKDGVKTYEEPSDTTGWALHSGEAIILRGSPLGTAIIAHQLVLFTTDVTNHRDYIYVLKYSNAAKTSMTCEVLFGDENLSLGFDINYPIETLVSYESEIIQKVYWTDGLNQPRIINIKGKIKSNNITQFDFIPTLKLQETVSVGKMLGANGMFAPGVIQYALTYYNKYGQESNIFYVSPLLYVSYRERGASPEDKVENAFRITVTNVDNNFDYLRIYSIHRTSVDATPICKRIQDIAIDGLETIPNVGLKASYIDIGTTGDEVDPTELFYKGGETISALTLEQKDNTLFLGNINITRPQIPSAWRSPINNSGLKQGINKITVAQSTRKIKATLTSTGSYLYANQLSAVSMQSYNNGFSVPCAGFKYGETYRLGVQFQYKTGKWSDPVWIGDYRIENKPSSGNSNTEITLPTFKGTIGVTPATSLLSAGYKRVRAVAVFPNTQDRTIVCQGIVNPTLWTTEHHTHEDLWAQSSWFFRAYNGKSYSNDGTCAPTNTGYLPYTHRGIGTDIPTAGCYNYDPSGIESLPYANIRLVEIQGDFEDNHKFQIGTDIITMHSPDVEFDNQLSLMDYSGTSFRQVGYSQFVNTMSDIDIQTETPTVSNIGSGFVHKSFNKSFTYGIISGLFYDDFSVDDNDVLEPFSQQHSSYKWMVYLWNRSGALNNDINRPADKGSQSSTLKKKVISNLRFANTTFTGVDLDAEGNSFYENGHPQVFSSEEDSILKLGGKIYKGNIDTMLIPDNADGDYYAFSSNSSTAVNIETPFTSESWWKTFSKDATQQDDQGFYKYFLLGWDYSGGWEGDDYLNLVIKKSGVRIKYKSTPHLAFRQNNVITWNNTDYGLPIIEILQTPTTRFGGDSPDALKENVWIPCGEPVNLTGAGTEFYWDYGDTYYQRWDCLKTYPFTREDPNQVVEIGSFMLETHVNIDGRYDRNRGQMNNLNMSPVNFNLLNPVYTQINNFFSYRIQDEDFYNNVSYPNQITWSKTKQSSAEVDMWTNITLAATLELDGDKGEVVSLKRTNNQLVCFQKFGISRLLYNENFMVSTQEGVPVEIANTGKVEGKTYISSMVGCANRWSIAATPAGLYFMDSNEKEIYLLGNEVTNVSTPKGFSSWAKRNIPSSDVNWTSIFPLVNGKSAFTSFYDKINQEILFINKDSCLAYSEKFGLFTSFYAYNNTPYFCNLDDTGVWIRNPYSYQSQGTTVSVPIKLWRHQAGQYCKFFDTPKPYWMTLIGNPEPQIDKIFTNLEFRATVDTDGTVSSGKFAPLLPFNSLETWNEYQHGLATLQNKDSHAAMEHDLADKTASLKRKFRIWRCDVPRDNVDVNAATETPMGIFRKAKHPIDRMRNPWLYLKLTKNAESTMQRAEMHDLMMTYFT